jgi:branched-chain amino acid transport system permease protein
MALFGWVLHRLVLERSARAGELVPILSTFGLAIVLDNSLFDRFGADTRSLAPYIDTLGYDSWTLPGDIILGKLPLLTFAVAVALLVGLHLLLARTALGRRIRAAAQDPDTAQLVGINARAVYAASTAIAMMMVAIAGAFMAMRATFDPYTGPQQLIFAFEAVVIGGAGSLWGTLVGGIVLGVAQSVGAQIHPQGFLIAGHVVFLVVLLTRLYFAHGIRHVFRALRTRLA